MNTLAGEQLSNLVQLGFMASLHGEPEKADHIFSGLHEIKPDNVDISMGLAVAKISAGHTHEAIDIIEKNVLEKQPDNLTAQVFLYWAHKNSGNKSEETDLLDTIVASQDAHAISLLQSID